MNIIKIKNRKSGKIAYIAGNSKENVENRYNKFFNSEEWERL